MQAGLQREAYPTGGNQLQVSWQLHRVLRGFLSQQSSTGLILSLALPHSPLGRFETTWLPHPSTTEALLPWV